ncbi:MAG TPA: alginate export family protein [Acidobacteriaceae bacterium]|nr:alginate export family protein [Acidobacteriaceae bacterium]
MLKATPGLFCLLALASAVSAQTPVSAAAPAAWSAPQAAPPAPAAHPLTFSVYERARNDTWQWFAAPPASETYSYLQSLLRISVAQRLTHWDWEAELTQAAVLDVPDDAVAPVSAQGQLGLGGTYYASGGNNTEPAAAFLKQAFIRYDAAPDKSIRLGRIEFVEGVELHPKDSTVLWLQNNRVQQHLIGNFGFANAQRSLDGIDAHYGSGPWDITAMAARSDQGVFNMNGNPELNVDTQYLAYSRIADHGRILVRAFAIGYHDGRTGITKTDNRPAAVRAADHKNIRLGTWGGDLIATQPAGPGTFDFVFWGAYQSGAWGELTQSAGAAQLEGGYRFTQVATQPWFRGGWWRSTGDNNPADSKNNTFFVVLPTPRVYARLPFYNMMNSTDSFIQLMDTPHKAWDLRSDLHWLDLTSGHDLWYLGGGAFDNKVFGFTGRPANGHTSFASVADISSDWQATHNVALNFYYGHGWGKSVVGAIYPTDKTIQFGYVEMVWRWGVTSGAGKSK